MLLGAPWGNVCPWLFQLVESASITKARGVAISNLSLSDPPELCSHAPFSHSDFPASAYVEPSWLI